MTAKGIFYRVTHGQPVTTRPPIVVQIEGARQGTTAAIGDTMIVWSPVDYRLAGDEWGDLAGVQFEIELPPPQAPPEQLSLFADYR